MVYHVSENFHSKKNHQFRISPFRRETTSTVFWSILPFVYIKARWAPIASRSTLFPFIISCLILYPCRHLLSETHIAFRIFYFATSAIMISRMRERKRTATGRYTVYFPPPLLLDTIRSMVAPLVERFFNSCAAIADHLIGERLFEMRIDIRWSVKWKFPFQGNIFLPASKIPPPLYNSFQILPCFSL